MSKITIFISIIALLVSIGTCITNEKRRDQAHREVFKQYQCPECHPNGSKL